MDSPDAETDATGCFEVSPHEAGDSDGHLSPLSLEAGQARAGRLRAEDLPVHRHGLLLWEPGDFVLANEHLALVIEDVGPSDLYDPYGGKPVGIARTEAGTLTDPADFNEVLFGIGRYTIAAEQVTVLEDGTDGGPAIVRAAGPAAPVPFINDFARALAPTDYDLVVAIDYELQPDARHVDIFFDFLNRRDQPQPVDLPLVLFFQRFRMPVYAPGAGFDLEEIRGDLPWVGFIEPEATSFAWQRPDGPLSSLLEVSGALAYGGPGYTIPGCARTRRHVARLFVGGPGLPGLLEAITPELGVREVRSTVRSSDGTPAVGAVVHATSDEAYLTQCTTDSAGTCTLRLPSTEASVVATRDGRRASAPQNVDSQATEVDIALLPVAQINVEVRDDTGTSIPGRVQLIALEETPDLPPSFGESPTSGRYTFFAIDGQVTANVPPGEYEVVVSRGYEWEMSSERVLVQEGSPSTVIAELAHVIPTPGIMCADFHIHTHRSPDSPDPATMKLASAIADGLEIPARSEHEWVADFEPIIEQLGVQEYAYGLSSLELTTFAWGHFGVVPIEAQANVRNRGAFEWTDQIPPEVFREVRSRSGTMGSSALIINHPRSSSGLGSSGAYFDAAGYDPATTLLSRPEFWDEEFQLVEVFNDSDFDENFPDEDSSTVRDWFSLLNSGRRVFAVGSSDSHRVANSPVGYPRTCLQLEVDRPAELREMGPAPVREALTTGQSVINGGIQIGAVARGDRGPGQQVPDAAAREPVVVTVRAASWIEVDRLRVFVDGALSEDIVIDDSTRDPMDAAVRFRETIEVSPRPGGWAIFVASGPNTLAPVHPGRRPFGVTNPIFF
ncbi:MAG: CehA/McbA family metallohydrolase [Myxococcota bacterium]